MSKIAVVYWSSTGNTQLMAEKITEGIKKTGADVDLMEVSATFADALDDYDKVAFGCPAMGDEELEEGEFAPYFDEAEQKISGKKVALFGSYDWGDGEWMRLWQERVKKAGADLFKGEGLIVNNTPEGETLEECETFGEGFGSY